MTTNPLIPFAAILLSLSSSYPVNMIKVSIAQKCTLGAQSPDLPWPLDWFWASNVVLANGMIYYLYENDLEYKGVPCFKSFQKNKVFLNDFIVHVSPGQKNWGKNFPSIIIKPSPIMVDGNLPIFFCGQENTVVDQAMIFGIRGYDMYGHIIFNSLHPLIGTIWEMGLEVNEILMYSMLDRKPQGVLYGDMIRVAQEDFTDPIDLTGFTTIFAKIAKDGKLHSLNNLLRKSFHEPICFRNLSIGHTNILDLYNAETSEFIYKRLQKTLFKIHNISENPIKVPNLCQIKLISRVKNRVIEDEDKFISTVNHRFPECLVDKIRLEKLSVKQQAYELQHKTSILIGLDGTGLLNALYMRPCSAVIRLLPWGGDFLSLLEYPEYTGKEGVFKNIALKVGALWYSYSLSTAPSKLYSKRRSGVTDKFIHHELTKQNKSYSEVKSLLAERFPVHIRLNHWKYSLNSAIGNATYLLTLLESAIRDSRQCSLNKLKSV